MSWRKLRDWWKKEDEAEEVPRLRGILFLWVFLVFALATVMFSTQAWANKSVVVAVDGREIALQTSARTVGGALEAGKVVLLEKDEVSPAAEVLLEDGMTITVKRALPIKIAVDGRLIEARTSGATVRDALGENGIVLGPQDELSPAGETPLAPDLTIRVARIRSETVVEEAVINYKVKNEYTTKLPQGSTRVAREGRDGAERRTWQISYRDGQEVNRQLASREVITQAADKVVMVGSGMVVSRGGDDIRYSRAVDMIATAYSHTGNNTASGIYPHYGAVAVDTSVIPLGTRLYVDGYGYATALDRGSAIRGNKIDLFFETHAQAKKWGVRRVKVYILD